MEQLKNKIIENLMHGQEIVATAFCDLKQSYGDQAAWMHNLDKTSKHAAVAKHLVDIINETTVAYEKLAKDEKHSKTEDLAHNKNMADILAGMKASDSKFLKGLAPDLLEKLSKNTA